MTTCACTQHRSRTPVRLVVWAALSGLLLPAVGLASAPRAPSAVVDPLAALRTEPKAYSCDLRISDLEPPGGEEYLAKCAEELEKLLDDELEYCQSSGLLSSRYQRSTEDGNSAFDAADRAALLAEAEKEGCKPRKQSRSKAAKMNSVAKRWRKATDKLAAYAGGEVSPRELNKHMADDYDAAKFGQISAEGLYRLQQRVQLGNAMLKQAASGFLVTVKGTVDNIDEVEDWKLYAKDSRSFGQEVKTGPDERRVIENIVKDVFLVGTDETFSDLSDDASKHSFEGYFLYCRQILTSDDVTTTVALVKRPEIDSLAAKARGLLLDYARVHNFRVKQLADRLLQYAEADLAAADLYPGAADIIKEQEDPAARLEALQKHFGAPVGRRTRTKDSKALEWTGPLTALSEEFEAELRIDTGLGDAPLHRVVFDAQGTPLGEAACQGKLKMGETVTVVGKVRKLEYDSSPESGSLLFTLAPLVAEERAGTDSQGDQKGKKGGGDKAKARPRKPRGMSTGAPVE